MKVKTKRGREVTWVFAAHSVRKDATRPRSKPHVRARNLLSRIYPIDTLYEEVPLPESRLRLDFLLPRLRLVVEVQGRQHFEYVPFMHKSRSNFLAALKRDHEKVEFCERNGLTLITWKDTDNDEVWTQVLAEGT